MQLRVSKYDPTTRSPRGHPPADEWTPTWWGTETTLDAQMGTWAEYRRVEDAYVESVVRLMAVCGVEALRMDDLVYGQNDYDVFGRPEIQPAGSLDEGDWLAGQDLLKVIRLTLSKLVWCRLSGPDGFYVRFGFDHDYSMYIGCDRDVAVPALPAGIYVESMPPPPDRPF